MRFFLSVLGVVILLVVAIVIITNHNNNVKVLNGGVTINLKDYNNSTSSLNQITTGNLVGNDQRAAVEISITQSQRTLSLLSGYDNTVVSSESFPNTASAYSVFLSAMQNARFTATRNTTETMFAVCPLGNTYQYQLFNNGSSVNSTWSTSCILTDGSFYGNGPLIRQLFELQIPNYQTYVSTNPLTRNLYFYY